MLRREFLFSSGIAPLYFSRVRANSETGQDVCQRGKVGLWFLGFRNENITFLCDDALAFFCSCGSVDAELDFSAYAQASLSGNVEVEVKSRSLNVKRVINITSNIKNIIIDPSVENPIRLIDHAVILG